MWLSKDLSHQISWSTECLTPPWTPSADVEDQQLRQHRVPSPQRQTANAPLVIQFLANALGRCQFVVDILFHSYLSSVFLLTGILSEFSISKEHRTCSKNPVMYPHLAVVWFPSFYLAWMSSGWGTGTFSHLLFLPGPATLCPSSGETNPFSDLENAALHSTQPRGVSFLTKGQLTGNLPGRHQQAESCTEWHPDKGQVLLTPSSQPVLWVPPFPHFQQYFFSFIFLTIAMLTGVDDISLNARFDWHFHFGWCLDGQRCSLPIVNIPQVDCTTPRVPWSPPEVFCLFRCFILTLLCWSTKKMHNLTVVI